MIIDVDQASLKNKPKNVVGMLFREEQAGYLAGYLAALEAEREGGKPVLGTVGGEASRLSTASSPATRRRRRTSSRTRSC